MGATVAIVLTFVISRGIDVVISIVFIFLVLPESMWYPMRTT